MLAGVSISININTPQDNKRNDNFWGHCSDEMRLSASPKGP